MSDEKVLTSKMRTITIPDWPENERGYRLSAERIAELIAEYVRYRYERQIPQPYLDIVSALSELAAYRRHVQGFTPETSPNPFDHAAIMGDPGHRRISMSFEKQEHYEAALVFLDMADSPVETTDQSRTVGEHQSGVALRSPDPANVAGGPRPLPEKASAPDWVTITVQCAHCGAFASSPESCNHTVGCPTLQVNGRTDGG